MPAPTGDYSLAGGAPFWNHLAMRRSRILLLLAFLAAPHARAGAPFPYELDTGRELALTGSAALLLGGAWLTRNVHPAFDAEQARALEGTTTGGFLDPMAEGLWSPTAARISDVLLTSMLVAPVGLLLTDEGRREPATLGAMYLEAQLVNNGVTALLKSLWGRSRPYVRNPDPAEGIWSPAWAS